ncbi:hypothetical protein M2372_001251 [Chryseobacterium sp. BIGb0232]|nr:hypothetical protein [Chryseobacterium sp. BIGb0232]ROS19328.1 hypothetical protein EDF65_0011 [Chryseobacterium nakagawai]
MQFIYKLLNKHLLSKHLQIQQVVVIYIFGYKYICIFVYILTENHNLAYLLKKEKFPTKMISST